MAGRLVKALRRRMRRERRARKYRQGQAAEVVHPAGALDVRARSRELGARARAWLRSAPMGLNDVQTSGRRGFLLERLTRGRIA